MKRIRVPEGAVKSFDQKIVEIFEAYMRAGRSEIGLTDSSNLRPALEAALLWLSEHPQVPTDEQLQAMREHLLPDMPKGAEHFTSNDLFMGAVEWQRRCFVQEEPDIPEEIKDLLDLYGGEVGKSLNFAVQEAYRRGLRKGEQK